MIWWKELSLILIIGSCIAVAAEGDHQAAASRKQQNKFLFNQQGFLNGLKPSSKPTPPTGMPYPPFPFLFPFPTVAATTTTRRPGGPRPTTPNQRPSAWAYNPSTGYRPIYNLQQLLHRPAGNEQSHVIVVYGDRRSDGRFFARNAIYPFAENEQTVDSLEDNQTELQDRENDNEPDYHTVTLHNDHSNNESEEESDADAVDSDHIKLPFGIELSSRKIPTSFNSNPKAQKQQEAVIYFRNIRNGRNFAEN